MLSGVQGERMQEAEKVEFKFKDSALSGALRRNWQLLSPCKAGQLVSSTCTHRECHSIPSAHRYLLTLLHSDSFSCRAAMARRRCSFSCSISRSERTFM